MDDLALREAIVSGIDAIDVVGIDAPSTIQAEAGGRSLRRRVGGGIVTIAAACALVLIGAGLLRADEPQAVFAGADVQDVFLLDVRAVDTGFVGVAVADPLPERLSTVYAQNLNLVLVESSDGIRWDGVRGAPKMVGTDAVVAERDGVLSVMTLQRPTSDTYEMQQSVSADGSAWRTSEVELAPALYEGSTTLRLSGAELLPDVGSGTVVLLQSSTGSWFDDLVRQQGVDPDEICDINEAAGAALLRRCGETEADIPVDLPDTPVLTQRTVAVVSASKLLVADLPEDEQYLGRTLRSGLYAAPNRVGVVGSDVYETTDGRTWELANPRGQESVFVARRGEEVLFRTPQEARRFGDDDPVWGMGYSDDGGQTWTDVDLGQESTEPNPAMQRFYQPVRVGEAGWAVVAAVFNPQVLATISDRSDDPVVMTADGYTLTAERPFGAAELTDPNGTVVQTWDHFELSNPQWSGLNVSHGRISVLDEVTSDVIVMFEAEAWAVALGPLPQSYEVLFSRDAINWSVLTTTPLYAEVMAIGDDEVILQRTLPSYASPLPFLDVLPLPDPGH